LKLSGCFFLHLLDDGERHSLSDVASELNWSLEKTVEYARYLARGDIIHYDEERGMVKIQDWMLKLPRDLGDKPGKRSVGSVILPPEGDITIQETTIYNDLDFDVEVVLTVVDGRLREIAVSKSSKC